MQPSPPPLTVYLFSFGYHRSGIPADEGGHGGGFVLDCRALPNPHRDEALRPYRGDEAPVVAFMEAHPQVAEFADHAAALVLAAARSYAGQGRERLMVSFGCTGGRHRSVYQAERLAAALRAEGIRVALRHLDAGPPLGKDPPGPCRASGGGHLP
jgi:RNase adaptor protein for sRNA GlmZ degradation